jgi:CyaY protein
MLEESNYNQLVSEAFQKIVAAADAIDPDLLESNTAGDMVALTAASGQKCVVSTQRAVRQIWVAGQGLGIHFSYDPGSARWLDDKGKGIELFQFVRDSVKVISGAALSL